MSDDVGKSDGHCKDVGHVKVVVLPLPNGSGPGALGAQFLATVDCVNVPDYHGWAVQLVLNVNAPAPNPSLRLLPGLAEVFPVWLRRARREALRVNGAVSVQHTFDGDWRELVSLSPDGARFASRAVVRALEQAPPGEHG